MVHTQRIFGEGGTSFSQAFATTPVCCPSRASILTGRYAHNHGVWTNLAARSTPPGSGHDLAAPLKRAGYQTAIAGKYLNAWNVDVAPPDFDTRRPFFTATTRQRRWWTVSARSSTSTRRTSSSDRAIDSLRGFEAADDAPWFLYLAPFAPHFPYEAAPEDADTDVGQFHPADAAGEVDLADKPPNVQALADRGGAAPEEIWAQPTPDAAVGRPHGRPGLSGDGGAR